ncbi:MDR family oxidoreductase [Frigoribacterium sp. VKM Ac-2836]|uniref:MDR family oxidoreductase n=1 Tax=Frigoribacterium sp. VKM Ac-2836 TaxID=2739014 RepID=UPI0015666097|nr:MDR family oxidoreductase [Frigoribacterium sp. VKM Ac-2836]NRD26445.1 oxidoreductase [Frigoribacterium sp. VKM Ac-2836]
MRAIVVEKGRAAELREIDEPVGGPGDVVVDVTWSGVNYKDGLALRGDAGVARVDPLVPGIDLVGVVASSGSPRFAPGDEVIVTGAGHGETRQGGFAERVVVDPANAVVLPPGIDGRRAAAVGTAGFTAMLSVLRLERDVDPEDGDVVVTGAAGGVGSVAIALLSRLGYSVTASSGRVAEQGDYLRSLGASTLIDRGELSGEGKPMQRARWAGGVDSVGSHTLATVLAQTRWGGTVTACGLAQGSDLPTTVLPFILRGVTLAGVDSVEAPLELRRHAWGRLARDLDLDLLDSLTDEVALADVVGAGEAILAGRTRGRTVVRVGEPRI